MTKSMLTRRRALLLIAASSATVPIGGGTRAGLVEWRGTALGADARLALWTRDRSAATEAIAACLAEIERLENIFSLYRPRSELSELNRTGALRAASLDMRRLVHLSRAMHDRTLGLFDPTIQPLWKTYFDWFSERRHREPPPMEVIRERTAKIGMDHVAIANGAIRLAGGVEMSLNGIAQGYITDRVAELLRARGWSHVLLDLGEVRALDGRPGGASWDVRVRNGDLRLKLANGALATSAGANLAFTTGGELTHIIDPRSGISPHHWRSITVSHRSAAIADALSTGLFAASPAEVGRIMRRNRGVRVWATDPQGTTKIFAS